MAILIWLRRKFTNVADDFESAEKHEQLLHRFASETDVCDVAFDVLTTEPRPDLPPDMTEQFRCCRNEAAWVLDGLACGACQTIKLVTKPNEFYAEIHNILL